MLRKGRVGVLCNQVAWHPDTGEYLFESLAQRGNLVRIFTPEHKFISQDCSHFTQNGAQYFATLIDWSTLLSR